MQDSRGFMWFGTVDGLNRFDGKSFKIFKREQNNEFSIGSNFIHCIKEDSQGRMLIGTKNGLYHFDTQAEKFHSIRLNQKEPDDTSINLIYEDCDGNIWLACHGQGLYILNPDLSVKKHYVNDNNPNSIPFNYVWTIVQDHTGNFWLGSSGKGLAQFNPKKEIFTKMDNDSAVLSIKDPTIYSLYCDSDNNLWIGTSSGGLYRYNYRTGKINNYLNQQAFNIKSIIAYSDVEIIMGSDKGLVIFNRISEKVDFLNNNYDNMTDNSIFAITKDREGSFWIGTYFGGVNYFSPVINKFAYFYNTPENSPKKDIISSIVEDNNGKIWLGSYNNGLSLFDPKTGRFESTLYNVGYHDVQDILFDKDDLYISLYGKGISVLNIKTGKISDLSENFYDLNVQARSSITSIFRSSQGYFLFTAEDGVSIFNPATKRFNPIKKLAGVPVKNIEEDHDHSIWFAAHAKGLFRKNADDTWDSFTYNPNDSASLPTNNINCVFQDSKFRIWIGTEGEGLLLFNRKTNRFERVFNDASTLPSNIIYSILDDNENNIWVTTGRGLVRIDADLTTVRTFGYIGDIQRINLKSALRASDNRLYFGGANGFIVFNPQEIETNKQIPPIVITGFQIHNKEIKLGDKDSPLDVSVSNARNIELKHDQSTFSFDFVALSYLSPAHNKYAYKLEGFDENWNYVTDNKAYYMNIPAGEYVFRVKGANNDGVWNEADTNIAIKIKPSFWVSNAMTVLYIITVFAACFYLILSYKKRIESKNRKKIYRYKIEKEKEIYEAKINFFTNIAHEIRTPLSLIIAPLENILSSGDGSRQTKNNLEIMEINANRLLELVNQLLDFRKMEENMFHFHFRQQDVVKIVQNVYNQYYKTAKQNNIRMVLSTEEEVIESVIDGEAIYKIISNFVSNAVKYAKEKIDIRVKTQDDRIMISVEDDGIGLNEKYLNKIFEPFFQVKDKENTQKSGSGLGLSLSQSLAAKHNGSISVESQPGEGALFCLTIPIVNGEADDLADDLLNPEEQTTGVLPEFVPESGLKILVVEDNRDLRTFLVQNLSENQVILEAENGLAAMKVIEKEHPDIIISDILMPEMDGLELCDAVKTNPAYSHIPLILLSAKTDTPTKIEGLKKGADVYLEKPFSIGQIKAQISSIIENRNNLRNNFIKSPLQYFKQKPEKNNNDAEFIEKLNASILENMSNEKFSIDSLSEQFFMSRSNFHKKIKSITGITPNDYIKLIRLNKSAQMLATGKYKINEVCYLVGFNTPSYFSKCFYDHFGKLPKDFILP
jgi:ligand-binding sensor domain-containing protein/DNA-binding response OmpR family regulator/nitrogen-specific signal transduction histidine kinase